MVVLHNNLCLVIWITVKSTQKRPGFYIFNEHNINCTRLENQEIKQVALVHSCDLLVIINIYIKHSDSFLVSGKVHKARNPTHQKRTSKQLTLTKVQASNRLNILSFDSNESFGRRYGCEGCHIVYNSCTG